MRCLRWGVVLLIPLLSLTACATASSDPQLKIVCPIIVKYTAAQQAAAAQEFEQVKKQYPQITRYITDYADLRRKIRICEATQ